MNDRSPRGPSSEALRVHAAAGAVAPHVGTRVADVSGREGVAVSVLSLDWIDVTWDDAPASRELVHTSRLHPAAAAGDEEA